VDVILAFIQKRPLGTFKLLIVIMDVIINSPILVKVLQPTLPVLKEIKMNQMLLALISIILLSSTAVASDEYPTWHPDYPGNGPGGSHFYIGMQSVKLGLFYFHKVYERWPSSWQEVRDSGIFQAEIPGFDLMPLNPDNSEITDYGQVYYSPPSNPESNPVVMTAEYLNGFHIRVEPANGYMKTYAVSFRDYDEHNADKPGREAIYSSYLNDENLLKLFAILGIMTQNIGLFQNVNGHLPVDMQEFMASGFSPVDANSINPVTGQPFRFDGSVGDASYEILENGQFRLRHVEAEPVEFGFTY
jgi:hypothetical protein